MLTERYLSAARRSAALAVGDPTMRPVTETFTVNKYLKQDDRVSDDLPFGSRGGVADSLLLSRRRRVRRQDLLRSHLRRPHPRPRGAARARGAARRREVKQITVGGPERRRGRVAGTQRRHRRHGSAGSPRRRAPKTVGVSFVKKAARAEGMRRPAYAVTSYEYAGDVTLPPAIGSVELRGPFDVTGPGDSPSRRESSSAMPPDTGALAARARTRARRSRAAPTAVRSPTSDIEPLMAFYRAVAIAGAPSGAKTGTSLGLDAGIEAALRRILVSPDFLLPRRARSGRVGPARPIGSAISSSRRGCRSSCGAAFPTTSCSTPPARGSCSDPAVLEQQVRRMLADPRSQGAGRQLRRPVAVAAEHPAASRRTRSRFPSSTRTCARRSQRETELFLESQMREDRSVVELLTADYTFVNERLARHYGIPNVYGSHFRRVHVPDDARAGLLGKAGILTVTSYANRTSPVAARQVAAREPPRRAAAAAAARRAGAAGERRRARKPRSVRERMEQHRANPVCASCHSAMDPLGFALENFDAIGRWRTTSEAGRPIDASGALPDGTQFDGPASCARLLLARREEFVATRDEKLLTYALGRGVEYYDVPAVRRIVRDAARRRLPLVVA